MRKNNQLILSLILIILVIPFTSSEILVNQPKKLYSLGDPMSFSTTIITQKDVNGFFIASLICNGNEQEFYKEYIFLKSGEEKKITPSILLLKNIVKFSNGLCKVKTSFNSDYTLTNEFIISDKISIKIKTDKKEFLPGSSFIFEGNAIKENGENVNGIIELNLISKEGIVETVFDTVDNGYFGINLSFDENQKAESYSINIKIEEKDSDGEVTNRGLADYNLNVLQIPRSLELVLENKEIIPGKEIKIKAIIHDQSGESIPSRVNITIKDSTNKVRFYEEHNTEEFAIFNIEPKELPGEWKVNSVYENFFSELPIIIKENVAAKFVLENGSLKVINEGNVPYTKTVYVRINDNLEQINVSLGVGESKDYKITAPDGTYDVEVSGDGANTIKETIYLKGKKFGVGPTGFVTNLRETSSNLIDWFKHPFILLFILLVLGVLGMIFTKKTTKNFLLKRKNNKLVPTSVKDTKIDSKLLQTGFPGLKNGAVLLLSLKGDRQPTTAVCLKIKNSQDVKDPNGSAHELIKKIVERAEQKKAVFYESGDYLFLMFVPLKTKTFDSERAGIYLADEISEMIKDYNRKFKQRINYGISVHKGEIIAKNDQGIIQFSALGNILNANKRYSSLSEGEILISKEINDKVMSLIKSEKSNKEQNVYILKEIKEREDHKKFISRFVQRQKIEGNKNTQNNLNKNQSKLNNLLKREEDGEFIDLS